MHAFNYHKPSSLADALSLAGKHAEGKILAGGQSLVQAMKLRLASPTDIIDLGGVRDLAGIKADGNTVTIGAMARHADVQANADVKKVIASLGRLARDTGH